MIDQGLVLFIRETYLFNLLDLAFEKFGPLWLTCFVILLLLSFFTLYVKKYYRSKNIVKSQSYRIAISTYYSIIILFILIIGTGIALISCTLDFLPYCPSFVLTFEHVFAVSYGISLLLFLLISILSIIYNIFSIREAKKSI